MSPEREEYLQLKAAEGVQEMSPERREYLRLKGGQEPDTLGQMRFEPEVQPAVSTFAPSDPERELRGWMQPEIQERPELGFGESAKAMGLGLIGGAIDIDPKGGSVLSRAVSKYHGEPAYQVGEMLGYAVPYTGAAKAVSGVAKAPRIARMAAKLPGLARAGVRGAATGATAAGFRETGRAIQGREPDISQVGIEAGLFGAADIALRGGGRVLKKLIKAPKPKPVTAPVKVKKAPLLLQGEKGKVVGKREVLGEPTELGFMGVTPESMKALGEPVTKAMRSISASTSQMIKGVKAKPEIVKGVKVAKETMIEHDRFIRQSEATSMLLKRTVEKAIPSKDRQMLMAHAIEHRNKGPFWDRLTAVEKGFAQQLSREKTKLDQFVGENKVLEMLPESENIRHLSHFWIDSKTGKPFKTMYGRLSKGLPQAKQRTIQDYATGMKATPDNPLGLGKGGMKPSTTNPGEMIGLGWESVMRAHQTRQMIKSIYNIEAEKGASIKLTMKGKPYPIRMLERWDLLEKQGLTEGYKRYSHYALDKVMIFKDNAGNLVRMKGPMGVKEEIFPHLQAYMENPTYNKFDNLISVSRSSKLGLSMFHAVSLAAQETALSLGKLVTGQPIAFARRIPTTGIRRGLKYRKEMGPVERLLYQEGLELFRHSEQMGGEQFFRGVGIPSKAGNILTAPVKIGRDFIFGVVQPGMKTAFAHDTFLSMLPKYLKGTGWTKEQVILAYDAGKTIPKEALKCARQAVQMADGHFSGEHWRRSLLETNRFMVKAYFSPTSRTAWSRGLLSPTWQREHLLVAKNVAKSFMPDRLIKKMKLAEIHPAAKAEYRQYLYGAVAVIGAVDAWNLMTTKMMDGESKHLWQNPEGKGFAVRASWNEPDYTVTDKNGKERTIRGGPAYIRPLKSLFEVAEWAHHPIRKFSYKLNPYISAIIAQLPTMKYRNYEGMKDIPKRVMDFMFDVAEPISVTQLVDVARGRKKWPAAVFPFFGMPVSKLKMPKKELAWEKKPSRSRTRQRPSQRR